ncbi:hypothetical protein LTS12_008746 [Elasticomyces elasticus]|nr:hypothetical protein LTS12_008746 [Elasticomyces elasticus]
MASFDLGDALWSAPRGTNAANHSTNPARSAWPRPGIATTLPQSPAFGFAAYQNTQRQTRFQQPARDPSYGNQFGPNYQLQQGIPSHASSGQCDDFPNAGYAAHAQSSPERFDFGSQPWQASQMPGVWNASQMSTAYDTGTTPWNNSHAWPSPMYSHGETQSSHPAATGADQGTVIPTPTGIQNDRPILQASMTNRYDGEQGEAVGGAGPDDFPLDFDFDFDFGPAGEWAQDGDAEQSGATGISNQSNSSAEAPDVPAFNYQSKQQAPYSHPHGGAEAEYDASEFSYDEEDPVEESEPSANDDSAVKEESGSDAGEPAYTHFASETAAADYSEGKVATARDFCQSIFDALLLPAVAAPAGLDAETYRIQQAKALEKCKSLMQAADGYKLASSRCALLYYAAVRLHTQGIAKDLLKSTCASTKTNLRLDRTSRFTTRMAKVIQTVSQNKLAAVDVLKDKSHDDFVRGPESYIRRKYTNAKGNANKSVVYTVGKEKLDGEDEDEEGRTVAANPSQGGASSTRGRNVKSSMRKPAAQATQTVNNSGPEVRKTAQGKRKLPIDDEGDHGKRPRSQRNKPT